MQCIALGNHQACAKLALLEHNFPESLMHQLKSLMDLESEKVMREADNIPELPNDENQINCSDSIQQKIENKTKIKDKMEGKEIKKEESCQMNEDEKTKFLNSQCSDKNGENHFVANLSTDGLNYNSLSLFDEQVEKDLVNSFEESVNKSRIKMSTSKSMDTLSPTENELYTFNCQGGSEEMYGQAEDNNISDQLTNSVSIDDELASDNSIGRIKIDDLISDDRENYRMNNERSSVRKAMSIVEFYINETENFNHVIVRDVLLKAINVWLDLRLPLQYLEKVFLHNLDKVFYPLGLILFW